MSLAYTVPSSSFYRDILHATDIGFCLLDIIEDEHGQAYDYRFVETNKAFAEQTGLIDADGRTARELVPGLEQSWVDAYAEVARSRQPRRFESGSDVMGRYFDVHAIAVDDPQLLRVALLFHDITARRRVELELRTSEGQLRESESRFRNMADHAPVMMWVTDPNAQAIYLNRAWHEFTGQTEDESRGLGWLDAVHPDDRGWSGETFLDANAARRAFRLEYRLRRHDGAYRWAIDAASPRLGPDGAFLGYVGSVVDIHDRKQWELDLQSQNASLRSVVTERTAERDRLWENTNDLLGSAGFDGRFRSINPAWSRLLGYTPAELQNMTFTDIIDPDDRSQAATIIARLGAGDTISGFVDSLLAKDGSRKTVMWTAVPDVQAGIFHMIGRDITEQRHMEDELRQAQKMEAVGQLTGGLAHDFNNILTGIIGSLELMAKRIAQGRYEDVERYSLAAQGAANRAAALTHRLLAFSRRQTLDAKPTNVNRLVSGMEDMVRRTVGPSITVEVVEAVGLGTALVDQNQLENALLNLCINARDAMPTGGRITIETANRTIDGRSGSQLDLQPGEYVTLCVSDTGTGMSVDVIAKAFDPFFTTKPIGMGTGLGLSMIYGFARQSGGQVRIYSEVGQGSTICIYLPLLHGNDIEDDDTGPQSQETARAAPGETVLIVDDDATIRMLVVEVLKELGYEAIEASDASSGLVVLQSDTRIDLLVTDVGLPGGMNGRQMADAARVARPELKVLFITGYAENAVVGSGHLDPGMHVITKPFPMDTLAARIKDLISEA